MILHLDMDAFFASVEQLDHPELRGRPVIIGGGARGVVSTASYEARIFGVHSAMPLAIARRLCPNGHFIRGRHSRYAEISRLVMRVLDVFSPCVEQASIDEAYADIHGLELLHGSIENLAQAIRARVFEATGGLSCSIGIAPVKYLAKICSDINKPGGLYILRAEHMADFLDALPVGRLPGVGTRMGRSLAELGIVRVGQLARYSREFLTSRFGKAGTALFERAHGVDGRKVEPAAEKKSESSESTLERDSDSLETLKTCLLRHAEKIGARLRKKGHSGRTITLNIKYADFTLTSRSKTLCSPTNCTQTIYEAGAALLAENFTGAPARLVGLSVSGFLAPRPQLELPGLTGDPYGKMAATPFSQACENRRKSLDAAIDGLRERFGQNAVVRGRLFGESSDK